VASEEVTTMTTVIAKEVMDPEIETETETDTLRVQEEDIIPTVKPRIRRKTATDVDAMNVIDPVDTTIVRGTEIGSGAESIVMRDQGVGHPKSSGSGRGIWWQDQIDRGNVRGTVKGKGEEDGLHHLVEDSYTRVLRIS
jgi:hypothetical protein